MDRQFWVLEPPDRRQADWDKGNLWRSSDYPGAPSSSEGSYVGYGGPAKRTNELRVMLCSAKITDFLWTTTCCLIQDRVVEALDGAGLTGFEVAPAHVRWKVRGGRDEVCSGCSGVDERVARSKVVPPFYELIVTGWGGLARRESGVTPVPGSRDWQGCPNWGEIVDRSQWDGSDIFMVWPYPLFRLVTDRVARVIKKHKFTGSKLIPIERFELGRELDDATPGRLSDYMPEPRAREIGEPLGIY